MPHEFDLDPIYIKPDANGNIYQNQGYGSSMGYIDTSDPLKALQDAANKNNQWSAEQAAKQNEFQVAQNEKAMMFSAEQAALNRQWQEDMSNTAHQREIIDLQKAGLNPVLSATGGNGASVGSGATAAGVTSAGAKGDTDESLTIGLMSYLAKMLEAQTSILNTQTSANAAMMNSQLMYDANIYGSNIDRYLGELSYDQSLNDTERYAVWTTRRALNDTGFLGHFEPPADPRVAAIQASGDPPDDPYAAEQYWREKLGDSYKPISNKSSGNDTASSNKVEVALKKTQSVIGKWIDRIKERNMNED